MVRQQPFYSPASLPWECLERRFLACFSEIRGSNPHTTVARVCAFGRILVLLRLGFRGFSWVFVRILRGIRRPLEAFACSLGVGNRGFGSNLHSRRRFIEPPKLLPTFLKDPYWKLTLCELFLLIRTPWWIWLNAA